MILATARFLYISSFKFLGNFLFCVLRKRRAVAIKNINRCASFLFKDTDYSKRKVLSLVRRSFVTVSHTFGDLFFLPWYTKKNIDRYVTASNFHYLEKAIASGRGVILSTGHFGSWELAGHYLALKGFPSLIIYNKFKRPKGLDEVIKKRRELAGNILILKQNSFLPLFRHLKKGGMVILLTDQHAEPVDGEQVPLLGQDAWTHTTFVKMSIKTGALIVPAYMHIHGYSKYVIEFHKPIDPLDYEKSNNQVYEMARASNEVLERTITGAPHLWMWQHRRFKKLDLG